MRKAGGLAAHKMKVKFLVVRFSSIGDIIQCMGVVSGIRERFGQDVEIHWIARKDMVGTLSMDKRIDRIWAFDRETGLPGLLRMARELRKERFDYLYDAHSNIRSNILRMVVSPLPFGKPRVAVRYKQRWKRFLLFVLGINLFDKPFRGVASFRKSLKKWGIESFPDTCRQWSFPQQIRESYKDCIAENTVTLIPSANWEMKRWPVDHYKRLVELLPEYRFVILGGPDDTFCEQIRAAAPDRVLDLAGKTTLMQSNYIVSRSRLVISADTGFMHAADLFHVPTLALMGPTAFGYPTGNTVEVLEVPLPCRPCTKDGRGRCKQAVYRRCMVDITPQQVARRVRAILPV